MEMYRVLVQALSKSNEDGIGYESLGEMNVYMRAKNAWRAQKQGKNLFMRYEQEGATEDIDILHTEAERQTSPVAIKPDRVYH